MVQKSSKAIAFNFLSLSVGQGISQIFNFFAIALAARFLGVENWGLFSSLQAIVVIISTFIDLGFVPIAFRENSKHNNFEIINTAIIVRVVVFAVFFTVFNLIVPILRINSNEVFLLNLLLLNILISSKIINIRALLEVPFKSTLSMHIPIGFNILDNFVLLILVSLMPLYGGGINYFTVVYLVSNLPGFCFMLFFLYRKFSFKISLKINDFSFLLKESAPVFAYILLNALYTQLDVLIIKYINSNYEVGVYSVSTRLTMPLNSIAAAITYATIPIIISNFGKNDEANKKIYLFVSKLLFAVAFFIALTVSCKPASIVSLLFGKEYVDSSLSFVVLSWMQIFAFYSFFVVDLLVALKKQKHTFYYSIILLVSGLSLDFLLIPKYSILGASIAKLISSVLSCGYLIVILKKSEISLIRRDIRVVFLVFILIGIQYIVSYLPLIPYLLLSITGSALCIYFGRYFNKEEINIILKMIRKEHWMSSLKIYN